MYLNPETVDIQNKLADYCKTGRKTRIDQVHQDRIKHYRRLVFGNVKSTLERAYPITIEWLDEEEWLSLVNEFFEYHNAQSPKIWELPKEFMDFVIDNDYAESFNKPALNDLLLIEWIEIDIHTMMDKPVPEYNLVGNWVDDDMILTPEFKLLRLDYPVHVYNGEEAGINKGDWFIYVFRNRQTDSVQFLNISALHVFVLEKLYDSQTSVHKVLPIVSSVFGLNDISELKRHLETFFSDLKNKGALLGYVYNK